MRLHHFAALALLKPILDTGLLEVTESNLSARRPHAGPDVVWLTDHREGRDAAWAAVPVIDREGRILRFDQTIKLAVRITVDVPDAVPWRVWSRAHRIRNMWYRQLAIAGGDPERWWVVERPIESCEWVEITDMATGEDLTPRLSPNARGT